MHPDVVIYTFQKRFNVTRKCKTNKYRTDQEQIASTEAIPRPKSNLNNSDVIKVDNNEIHFK